MSILTELQTALLEEFDQGTAERVVEIVRSHFGGESYYIPRAAPLRQETIRQAAASLGVKEAAKACGVTERWVYQILGRAQGQKTKF
ncbi:hypothetical protein KOM00_01990 [Geomonas sp. Red69]|uniref:Mor transcription activator family protein n=1 Tax=Geomonas diazotrophica TaxID=2843197 RepID=UPI001C0FA19A|nr:Mor transcription activator family protein [Geomonas diazotrophica]MBU5635497.1 hypothetical protein [Geomonas diazotrophica]